MSIEPGEIVERNRATRWVKRKIQRDGQGDVIKYGTMAWKNFFDKFFEYTGRLNEYGKRIYRALDTVNEKEAVPA